VSFRDYTYRGQHRRSTGRGAGSLGTLAAAGVVALSAPVVFPGTAGAEGVLDAIERCESGGKSVPGYSGRHFGLYQFDLATWRSVDGPGHPLTASRAQQRAAAERLLAARGTQPWTASRHCWGHAAAVRKAVSTPRPPVRPARDTGPVRIRSVSTTGSAVPDGYRVRRGDTLGTLSVRYRTSVSAIAGANRIGNPDRIYVGQRLR
jgi:LysM repeat protein